MLVLFDIDATLISTGGVGMRAMVEAAREVWGQDLDAEGVEFAGRLDPLIIRDLALRARNGVDAGHLDAVRHAYSRHLERHLSNGAAGRALPGVVDLVARLSREDRVCIGLLTGNFEMTGSLKLRACGIDPAAFTIAAWGDDSRQNPPSRTHLPPVAVERYVRKHGRRLTAREVVVIGDTPHDAACALAHGHRCLGVATGKFTEADLARCGFDRVVRDLSDTDDVFRWLMAGG